MYNQALEPGLVRQGPIVDMVKVKDLLTIRITHSRLGIGTLSLAGCRRRAVSG